MAPDSKEDVLARIQDAMRDIKQIQKICRVPSISFGVSYQGETIFTECMGVRDVNTSQPPNPDTRYHLASVSKCFASALAGIAVSEGKLNWKALIADILPGFGSFDDPDVEKGARILDCLRHSSGVPCITGILSGPNGTVVTKEEDFIELLRQSPSIDSKGGKRYNTFNYSNEAYGLVALCLQKIYGKSYSQLLREKILKPLGMDRTSVCQADLEGEDNLAHPTATLENGSMVHLSNEYSIGDHAPVVSTLGMLSSVTDMLTWAKAILEAEKAERENSPPSANNPLRNVCVTRGKAYWERPTKDKFQNDSQYCFGWFRVVMPSAMLGSLTLNSLTRDKEDTGIQGIQDEYILGTESPKTEVILHTGLVSGSTSAFFTFPETQSAIIVFTNGVTHGDAADWIAQMLTQALLGSKPHIDLLPLVKIESEKRDEEMFQKMIEGHQKHRDVEGIEGRKEDYVGTYTGRTLTLCITLEEGEDKQQCLTMRFKARTPIPRRLEFYAKDTYSLIPKAKDEWLANSLECWGHGTSGVFRFNRNDDGSVTGLVWKFMDTEYPLELKKMTEEESPQKTVACEKCGHLKENS